MPSRFYSARQPCRLLTMLVCLSAMQVGIATADDAVDYSEYDAILALDESQLSEFANGWHGGLTVDNAVADEDGNAKVGADLHYLSDDREFSSYAQMVDQDIYRAALQYSQLFFATSATRWLGVVSAGYGNDTLADSDFGVDFDDRETAAGLALKVEHEFARAFVSSQLQTRWRRIERQGESIVLDQPTALDAEKDFRALGWNLAAQWRLGGFEQALWLQVMRITDMDVSVCLDEVCLLTEAVEQTFTLYDVAFEQAWYLTARQRDGVSLSTQLAGYSANVDHVPYEYEYSVGGMYSVRGYDEGIAGGDEMALWRNELRLPWRSSSAWLGGARQHAYVFYDWGMVWQQAVEIVFNERAFELLPETSTRLCSAGVGIDLAIVGDISLRVEYAVAQAALPGLVDRGDARVHASLDWRAF